MTSTGAARPGPWARRFLELIESAGMHDALRGGRRLARTGSVLSHYRSGNVLVANVRDPGVSPADPAEEVHRVRIAARAFNPWQWEQVAAALAGQTSSVALLLAGRMPPNIERVVTALGLTLLPQGAGELAMSCTCQDWQVPCPHVAAACYALANEFDADPFELFGWRGKERRPLLDRIRELRARAILARGGEEDDSDQQRALSADPTAFWSAGAGMARSTGADAGTGAAAEAGLPADADERPATLMDQCGPLPVDRLGDLAAILRPAYLSLSAYPGNAPDDAAPAAGKGPRLGRL